MRDLIRTCEKRKAPRLLMALGAASLLVACSESIGGQSGGESLYKECEIVSRTALDAASVADGFAVSPQTEMDLYAKALEGAFPSAASDGTITVSIAFDDEATVYLVDQQPNQSEGGAGDQLAIAQGEDSEPGAGSGELPPEQGEEPHALCPDYYELSATVSVVYLAANASEPEVRVDAFETTIGIDSTRKLTGLLSAERADVQGSLEPTALVGDGYENIALEITLGNTLDDAGAPAALTGSLAWTGDRSNAEVVEHRIDTIGAFNIGLSE